MSSFGMKGKTLKQERRNQYLDKITHGKERIVNIKEWREEDYESKTRLAFYKAGQEVIEVCMDLLAMTLKDTEIPPKDDYSNIENGVKTNILNKEQGNLLKEVIGLRNRLIHVTRIFICKKYPQAL